MFMAVHLSSLHGVGMYYYHIIYWLNVFLREKFLKTLVCSPAVEMKKVWALFGLYNMRKMEHKLSNSNKWISDSKYNSNSQKLNRC